MKNKIIITGMAAAMVALLATGCASEQQEQQEQAALQAQAKISKEQAQQTALGKAPGGTVKEAELEKEKGKLIWSFDIAGSPHVTEVNVDAITGDVVSVENESSEQPSKGKESAKLPPFSHPRDITNPLMPLASLQQDILESKTEHVERTLKPDVKKIFVIDGQTVEALAVEDKELTDGNLVEITLDYFAQDDDGNVYYLGEDVDEYKNGNVSGHGGGWLLGRDTQTPGLLMPGHPQKGDTFMAEDAPPVTREKDEVVSVGETVTVPAGAFANCVKVKENASDGSTEYKYYAPGIGCIEEAESDNELLLKSHAAK